jgi:hypothetical protein
MKLARYWTRAASEATGSGGNVRVTSRGWSKIALRRRACWPASTRKRLPGALLPIGFPTLPEAVLREFQPDHNGPAAVVTRNAYGAVVLNTRDFVDIDRDDKQSTGIVSGIRSLFCGSRSAHTVLTDIQRVAERNNLAGRVYKTAAGYRVLITNAAFQAGSHQTEDLLRQFGADPLYTFGGAACRNPFAPASRPSPGVAVGTLPL